ncbi:hypothetical protein AA0114_g8449 [Alternaria tenuissima]|uniref:Heterokaryon incompatibility domain-containing protein n=1 Tax=Alternaria tenuissima TaxID=119927 RepID=A0A4V1WM83_9PLEO|nr:hypothetical protein AA0114_g8449 [Alternaria tenuissima]
MAELPCFVYDQLPAGYIRLLTPTSSSSEDGQSWSLQTVSLDQPDLVYEALSYAWGSQAHLFPITLNGCVLYVHGNLHSALPYLAGRGKTRPVLPIWIDAICINQAHHEEKMIQIREMNRIHRYAAKVWVWIGIPEYPERVSEAMDTLESLKGTRVIDLSRFDLPLRSAICHLELNGWFRRLWVVQEAALAKEISFLSGDVELQWLDMERAMARTDNDVIFHTRQLAQWYWNDGEILGVSPSIILMNVAFLTAATQECARPEDRVLGLLGMVNQDDLRGSPLDPETAYTSYQDLFTRFSACMLTEYPDPNSVKWWAWLSMAFGRGKCDGLPSWVPDFHNTSRTSYYTGNLESRVPYYQAAIGHKNEPRGDLKIGQLMLRGRILDEVVVVFEPIPMDGEFDFGGSPARQNLILMIVAEWEEKLAHDVMHSKTFETRQENRVCVNRDITLDTYWRTLISDVATVQDEVVMPDWYDDFQAIGRGLRETDTTHENEG